MKNIIWTNEQDKIIVTTIIDDEVNSEDEKQKLINNGEVEGFTFIGLDYSEEDLNTVLAPDLLIEAKSNKIGEIKNLASFAITSIYPVYDQLNILVEGNSEQISEMRETINIIRDQSNNFENEVNSSEDISFIKNLSINY
jgi:hypothetical protein